MVILFVILFRKHIPKFPLSYFHPFPFVELKNLLKIGIPSAGENMSYSFSQVVLTYFINMLGNEALTTRTYVVNIVMFVYLFAIAMAQGGAICIGHLVGEKKIRAAYLLGKYVMRISILVSLVLSCIWALMGYTLFGWLTDNPEIVRLGTIILFIDVILEVGRAINIYATNALRATGDVNYPFYVGLVVQWGVAVGCGYLFGIHDQYRDYYLDAPTFDPAYATMLPDGSYPQHARWAGGPQTYLCATQAQSYVRRNFTF